MSVNDQINEKIQYTKSNALRSVDLLASEKTQEGSDNSVRVARQVHLLELLLVLLDEDLSLGLKASSGV